MLLLHLENQKDPIETSTNKDVTTNLIDETISSFFLPNIDKQCYVALDSYWQQDILTF